MYLFIFSVTLFFEQFIPAWFNQLKQHNTDFILPTGQARVSNHVKYFTTV